ncbi:MAG: SIS domain-containing protein [Nanoarchaeota archaeon]|nr:SIS domain-containing protein [Nanoarchaeota archaeon]
MEDLDYELLDPSNLKATLEQQGRAVKQALEENDAVLKQTAVKVNQFDKIILSGCGDKHVVPMITQYLTDAFSKKLVRVIHSRLLANYTPEWVDAKTLVIFLTASGTTKDVIDAINEVKKKKAEIIILTQLSDNKKKDSIYSAIKDYQNSQVIIPLKEGVITWPATTTFHTFLAVLNMLFIYVLMENNTPVDALLNLQYVEIPDYIDKLCKDKSLMEWCAATAKKLLEMKVLGFYFLGDGPRYAAVRKGALVHFVESCKEDSFPIENEEFIHLVIESLAEEHVEENVLIIMKPRESYITMQAYNQYELIKSLWRERAGKDRVITVDPFEFVEPTGVGKKNDILLTPLYVIVLEWLAYYYALYKKIDPAKMQYMKK